MNIALIHAVLSSEAANTALLAATPEPVVFDVQDVPAPVVPDSHPWYNDLSHTITDSTLFRILLIIMVIDWLLKLRLFK